MQKEEPGRDRIYDSGRKFKKPPQDYISSRFGSPKMSRINHEEQIIAKEFSELLGESSSIIDVPCGSGRFLKAFNKQRLVYAIDANPAMLQEAKLNNPDQNIQFYVGNINNIPLESKSADGIFCMRLLHHVSNHDEIVMILSELKRVTKAFALISFYRAEGYEYWKKKILRKKISGKPIKISKMAELLKSSGFSARKIYKLKRSKQTICIASVDP